MAVEESYGKVIDAIRFGVFSPQEIRKLSVAEIKTADTYDEDGAVIPSGLMDNRLGVLEPGQRCGTCGNTATKCPGHFGHIELAVPIIHVEFTKSIHDLLQAFCRNCGRILLDDKSILKAKARSEEAEKLLGEVPNSFHYNLLEQAKSTMQCPHCGSKKIQYEDDSKKCRTCGFEWTERIRTKQSSKEKVRF